jgi:hypothetical protein
VKQKQSRKKEATSSKETSQKMPQSSESDDPEYKVGPGHPPKEYQFKKGQSGNPKGRKKKTPSIAAEVRAIFQRVCSEKVVARLGEREREMKKIEAGLVQLANQFATGDRHARRDFFWLAAQLGIDLSTPAATVVGGSLPAEQKKILQSYIERETAKMRPASREIAPPELLDDDSE